MFYDWSEVVRRIGNDVLRVWDLIAIGCSISFAFSLLSLIFFRFPNTLPLVISASSLLCVTLFGFLAYFLNKESDRVYGLLYDDWEGIDIEGPDNANMHTEVYVYLSYAVVGVAALVLLSIVCLIPSLGRSVHILRLSARPLKNIPSLLAFPLVEIVLGVFFICLMTTICLYAISIGTIDEVDTDVAEVAGGEVKVLKFSAVSRLGMIFVIPMSLWWLSFLSMVGEYVVASASSVWFFSKDK